MQRSGDSILCDAFFSFRGRKLKEPNANACIHNYVPRVVRVSAERNSLRDKRRMLRMRDKKWSSGAAPFASDARISNYASPRGKKGLKTSM